MADVYDTYLDVARDKFDAVLNSVRSLDAKSFQSLATGTIVLGVGASLGGFEAAEVPSLVFLILAAITFAFLAFCTFRAARVMLWSNRPDLDALYQHLQDTKISFDAIRLWTAQEYVSSVGENNSSLISKGKYTTASMVALSIEVILLLVGVVVA